MGSAPPTLIWRKHVSVSWFASNEVRLFEATGGDYAVIERPGQQRILVEAFCSSARVAQAMKELFGGAIEQLAPDWQLKAFAAAKTKPFWVGKRLIVASAPADLPKEVRDEGSLIIPAGVAFGTGEHATTAMSVRILERVTRGLTQPWRMLDAGTGSGILALAGSRFGAREVIAIDNDPMAIATAKANAAANGVAGVRFRVADATQPPRGLFDIITANLYSELLIRVLPIWRESLRNDGRLILSGVMRNQERAVLRALAAAGFRTIEARRRGKWIALLCAAKNVVDGAKRGSNLPPP
jgi:ribosomal protein L11 methyltransferase